MPNPYGVNGTPKRNYPSEDELRDIFRSYQMEGLTVEEQLTRFCKEVAPTGRTKFFKLKKACGADSVRKCKMSWQSKSQAVITLKDNDVTGRWGVSQVKTRLARQGVLIPRDHVRLILHDHYDHEFAARFYSSKGKQHERVPLRSLGPWHQEHCDGHEKLAAQAIQMGGGVSFPIYGTRDQCTGFSHGLDVRPNVRRALDMVHYYLDLVERRGNKISITMVFDLGTETAEVVKVHHRLRLEAAPEYTVEKWPPCVQLSSVHNTPIESFWRQQRQGEGYNIRSVLEDGRDRGLFDPNDPVAVNTLYWVFVPLIQSRLDEFRDYHNHKRTRKDKRKLNPSGHTPDFAMNYPESVSPPGYDCAITVSAESIRQIRAEYGGDAAAEAARRFITREFEALADAAYDILGRPPRTLQTAWNLYQQILTILKHDEYDF